MGCLLYNMILQYFKKFLYKCKFAYTLTFYNLLNKKINAYIYTFYYHEFKDNIIPNIITNTVILLFYVRFKKYSVKSKKLFVLSIECDHFCLAIYNF